RVRHARLQLDDPRAPRGDEGSLVRHLIAEIHDQQLRRQRLARVPRRADLLATAALRAREEIQHLLAREVGRDRYAELHVRVGGLEIDSERLEVAPWTVLREIHV